MTSHSTLTNLLLCHLVSSIVSFGHASPEICTFAALLPVAAMSPLSQTLNASSKVPAEAGSVALLLSALLPALLLHQWGHTQGSEGQNQTLSYLCPRA